MNKAFNLALIAVAGFVVLLYPSMTRIQAANAGATILANAAKPLVNLKNPQSIRITYTGAPAAVAALRAGTALPTALVATDFDADGAMDMVAGYSTNSGGVLALVRGNPDAYAPKDHSLYKKAMRGIVPTTFSSKASVVAVPESPDFLVTGDFNRDGRKDVLVAARGGALYLLAGDGRGHLLAPQEVPLSGQVMALAVTSDAHVAVSMDGPGGPSLAILAPSSRGLIVSATHTLPARGDAVAWGNLGGGADLAIGAGRHIVMIYNALGAKPQTETVNVPFQVLALTLGDFIWDRDGRTEISVLANDGSIHILQHGVLDTHPLTASDIPGRRAAMTVRSKRSQNPTSLGAWRVAKQLPYTGLAPSGPVSPSAFNSPRLAAAPTHDLLVLDAGQRQLNILDTSGTTASSSAAVLFSGTPVAALALPQKINAGRDIVVLISGQVAPVLIPADPDFLFTVTTVNDEDDASACSNTSTVTSGAGADGVLSLREAVCEANNSGAGTSVINVPAGTYSLSISTFGGNGSVYESGEIQVGNIAGTNISIVGTGTPSNTIINQTDGVDRLFEQDQALVGSVAVSVANVALAGGTPTTGLDAGYGGGAILGGGANGDDFVLTDAVMSNNITAPTAAGGAVNFLVANFTAINSTFSNNIATQSTGGACACGSNDGQGNLVFTNSIFSNNIVTDASTLSPPAYDIGGALDLTPGIGSAATISGSTFTGNQAQGSNGIGGAINGDGATTVSNSRIVGNSAATGSGFVISGDVGSIGTVIDNWWGCNAGPSNTGCDGVFIDTGDGATGAINPWLVLSITASSTQFLPNGTATLTADLTHDSAGTGGFSVPDGTGVVFGGTLGTDNPASAITTNGLATSTFTAGATTGTGSGTATVDNQTVSVTINIGQPPAISSSNSTTFTVGAAGSFIVTATGSPNPSITESGTLPGGIRFVDNGNGTGTLSGTPSPGTGGVYNITFTAQNGFSPNATQSFTLTVNQAPIITSANNATFAVGTAGFFTLTTSAFPTAAITAGSLPSGVGFVDNHNGTGTLSGTPTVQGVFIITFTASNGVGSPAVQTFTLTVGQAPTTVTLTSSLNPSTYGQAVTFTATVASPAGTPTGTVTFMNGTGKLGTSKLASGVATLTTTTLVAGIRSITAVYGGSANFSASTSAVLGQVVNQATTTVTLTSSLNPSTYGQAVTFTATVASPAGTPTGTVTFKNAGAALGTATLTGGVATLMRNTTSLGGVGTKSISAVYNGSAAFSASTSSVLSQVVNQATTTTTLTSSLNPSTFGRAVTFTATVTPEYGGQLASGVTFKNGSAVLGTVQLAGGVATLTTTALSVGTKSITAVYNGGTNFSASTSAVLGQVVNQATTTVTLTSSLNPSTYGQAVTFTATVASPTGTPTGTVTFKNAGAALGTATLTGGVATLATSALPSGTLIITSLYTGNTNFGPSSATLTQTVNPVLSPSYALTATTLNPGVVTSGNTSTSSIQVTPLNGYTGSVSLSCSMISGGTPTPSCSFSPALVMISGATPGTATLTVLSSGSTPTGNYSISVTASDANGLAPSNGPQALALAIVSSGSSGYGLTATALNPGVVTSGNTSTSSIQVTPLNGYTSGL